RPVAVRSGESPDVPRVGEPDLAPSPGGGDRPDGRQLRRARRATVASGAAGLPHVPASRRKRLAEAYRPRDRPEPDLPARGARRRDRSGEPPAGATRPATPRRRIVARRDAVDLGRT